MSGWAASLLYFANKSPNFVVNDIKLRVGEAEGISNAVILPPKSCYSYDATCSSAEVVFTQHLDYSSKPCQASRELESCLS